MDFEFIDALTDDIQPISAQVYWGLRLIWFRDFA